MGAFQQRLISYPLTYARCRRILVGRAALMLTTEGVAPHRDAI